MPTQWAHRFYWSSRVAGTDPTAGAGGGGGYPAWESAVIAHTFGSGLGVLQGLYERAVWWGGWVRRLWSLSPSERVYLDVQYEAWRHPAPVMPTTSATMDLPQEGAAIVARVTTLLQSPEYAAARSAVRDTAMTLGFRDAQYWAKIGAQLRDRPHWAENMWRHLHAMAALDATRAAPRSNPDKNLLIELAYHGYTIRPRD